MKFKKITKIVFRGMAIIMLVISIPAAVYTLKYIHWYTKSQGYPGLYQQEEYYHFGPAPALLLNNSNWAKIVTDSRGDGDIPNWSDAKSLSQLQYNDTLWFKYELHNNIDINEPMVSLALDIDGNPNNGTSWYGTTPNFNYDIIIAAGYVREGIKYKGYNFIDKKVGFCKLYYALETNSFLLGIPILHIKEFEGSRFVASAGNKGLWNDDFDNGTITNLKFD